MDAIIFMFIEQTMKNFYHVRRAKIYISDNDIN